MEDKPVGGKEEAEEFGIPAGITEITEFINAIQQEESRDHTFKELIGEASGSSWPFGDESVAEPASDWPLGNESVAELASGGSLGDESVAEPASGGSLGDESVAEPASGGSIGDESVAEPASECESDAQLLPKLDLEHYEPDVKEASGVEDRGEHSTRYGWIGVGQCGGRLVNTLYDVGYENVLAVDTTGAELDLVEIPENQKFLMYIREKGPGTDVERCEEAVEGHKQGILSVARQIFGTGVQHIMVCFGAGGATSSGSIAGLIEIAKRYARSIGLENPIKKVGVVMTLPALGKVRSEVVENSYRIASQLSKMAEAGKISPLIIVDNNKVNNSNCGMTTKSLWNHINTTFVSLFDIFNRLSASSSQYTSFDPFHYRSIMQTGGCVTMGVSRVDKFDGRFVVSEAVENGLHKTLCASGFDLSTAKEAGCIIVGGKDVMTTVKGLPDKIESAFDVLSEITGQATVHRGIYEDDSDCLMVCTIVGGLSSPADRLQERDTDLYYRMNKVNLKGPPLHQRKEDILPLAEYFLAKQADFYKEQYKCLSSEAEELLFGYAWPGDVEELAHAMGRVYELSTGRQIQPAALPLEIIFSDSEPSSKHLLVVLNQTRRDIITRALELSADREPAAAKSLGIEHHRLKHLIKKLDISPINKNIVV
jgi:cell division GTPase FtsZ